MNAIKEITNM